MPVQLKKWGNGQGIRFSKEFLSESGLVANETLNAAIINGQIVLSRIFRHRSLKERAAEYGDQLDLSDEPDWNNPAGTEVW